MPQADFLRVDFAQPHPSTTKRLLAAHPEIRQLIGHNPWSGAATLGLVALQTFVAIALARAGAPWWAILATAWTLGAVVDHALWVMIHEATHYLMFRKRWLNQVFGYIANCPLFVPAYASFQRYHLRHHARQGEYEQDADLPSFAEIRLVGNNTVMKALWLLFFPVVQATRPMHLNPRQYIDGPVALTMVTQLAYLSLVWWAAGWWAIAYLVFSLFASIGLHPLGARWIQEHYTFSTKQETFSYYGQGNRVAFNVGFHNEHHDFPSVPWNHLPRLRSIAAEHYDALDAHRSWTRLLFQFLSDPRYGMTSRVVRPSRDAVRAAS